LAKLIIYNTFLHLDYVSTFRNHDITKDLFDFLNFPLISLYHEVCSHGFGNSQIFLHSIQDKYKVCSRCLKSSTKFCI